MRKERLDLLGIGKLERLKQQAGSLQFRSHVPS